MASRHRGLRRSAPAKPRAAPIQVRVTAPGQVLKVTTDDPAASEDLSSWCRMSGNELVDRVKGDGFEKYYIRRGRGP